MKIVKYTIAIIWSIWISIIASGCSSNKNLCISHDGSCDPVSALLMLYPFFAKQIIYYVSPSGDNSAEGLDPEKPLATIHEALNRAITGDWIYIAEGTYYVNSDPSLVTEIHLKNGVSLYGGYAGDFSIRDPVSHPVIIKDESVYTNIFIPSDCENTPPNRAIHAGTDITTDTIVDGFQIIGGGGGTNAWSSAIFLRGSPAILNNIINGGNGYNATGIIACGSSALIEKTTIRSGIGSFMGRGIRAEYVGDFVVQNNVISGDGKTYSIGVELSSATENTLINANVISGGSGSGYNQGIRYNSSAGRFINNIIYGGMTGTTYGVGINGAGNHAVILNNTIDAGTGSTTIGIYSGGSSSYLYNNIIYVDGEPCKGIEEGDPAGDITEIKNNSISPCATRIYDMDSDTNYMTIGELESLSATYAANNADLPVFADIASGNYRLDIGTPASILSGGLNAAEVDPAAAVDHYGNIRPTVGVTMGAIQY